MKHFKFITICLRALLLILCSCSQKTENPTTVMNKTIEAILSGNADVAWENMSASSKAHFKNKQKFKDTVVAGLLLGDVKQKLQAAKVVDEKIEGKKATLTMEYPGEGEKTKKKEIECVLEGNQWKIDIQPLIESIME